VTVTISNTDGSTTTVVMADGKFTFVPADNSFSIVGHVDTITNEPAATEASSE
jgi:hypothetical protein